MDFRSGGIGARNRRSVGFVTVVILLGAVIGTLLGHVVALVLPDGVVKEFFTKTGDLQFFKDNELDIGVIYLKLSFTLKVSVIGIIGIIVAIYLLRWY
jgi:hypothetical protein